MVTNFYTTNFLNNLKSKVEMLSIKDKFNIKLFLNLQFYGSVLVFIMFNTFGLNPFISFVIAWLYAYMLYLIGVTKPLKRRTEKLEHEAIIFFETTALSLESGANLETALEVSSSNINSELSDEFKKTLMDIRFGKTLDEALQDMIKRIPSGVINNTITNIHQSLKLGSSITDNLYEQINYLQEVEVSNIKKHANTIPAKVSIISVLMFIPLVLLLILAPVILTLIR